ncbi:MAG: hypothetical protein BKP49_04640 [Treponema sp. CETP13]|nr:MAG: hypothetical protein BKP49_04640 [Treponema sp. CETP13]
MSIRSILLSSRIARDVDTLAKSTRINESKNYIQHGKTSVYEHSLNVTKMSCAIARFTGLHVDVSSLVRGALLHDYFLYDWHIPSPAHKWHGFRHPAFAFANANRDCKLTYIESDIIRHHMFPLTLQPPKTREGLIVCIADKICAIHEMFSK